MTDKQIKETKNGFYCIEPCCEIKELKEKLLSKEQECKTLREEKAYIDMACEQFENQLKAKEQECEELKEEAIKRSKELIRIRKERQEGQKMNRNLHKQLDQLKADNDELKKLLKDGGLHNLSLMAEKRVLLQTLAEIKDYCNKYPQNSIGFKKQILQKISEVENEHIN